jgi:hypothetical protein
MPGDKFITDKVSRGDVSLSLFKIKDDCHVPNAYEAVGGTYHTVDTEAHVIKVT